jgi:hypothetical protein
MSTESHGFKLLKSKRLAEFALPQNNRFSIGPKLESCSKHPQNAQRRKFPRSLAFQRVFLSYFAFVHVHEVLACLIRKGAKRPRIGSHCVKLLSVAPLALLALRFINWYFS